MKVFNQEDQLRQIGEHYDRLGEVGIMDTILLSQENDISSWTALQQLDHITSVNKGIISGFERIRSSPAESRNGLNLMGRFILGRGKIKRGVAKSPRPFVAAQSPDHELIRQRCAEQTEFFAQADPNDIAFSTNTGTVRHPYFGKLNGNQWLRLVNVHTHHHLKIVNDILLSLQGAHR